MSETGATFAPCSRPELPCLADLLRGRIETVRPLRASRPPFTVARNAGVLTENPAALLNFNVTGSTIDAACRDLRRRHRHGRRPGTPVICAGRRCRTVRRESRRADGGRRHSS